MSQPQHVVMITRRRGCFPSMWLRLPPLEYDGIWRAELVFPVIAGALILMVDGRTRLMLAVKRAHLSQRVQ